MNEGNLLFYLSLAVLSAASAHLLLLLVKQIQRRRLYFDTIYLKRQLLERQVDELIARSQTPPADEFAWSGWRKFRVSKIVPENDSINSFYLLPHDGKALAEFMPGQHITLRLKVPGQSKPVIRCYSLSDDASETGHYRISVKKQLAPAHDPELPAGIASSYLHGDLVEGDVLDVKAPAGKFFLDLTEKSPVVLVAGGVGVTPSLSMLNTLYGLNSSREVWLLYATQNPQDQILREHFSKLEYAMPQLNVRRFYGSAEAAELGKTDQIGHITCQGMREIGIPFDADFYVCGPPPMMDSIVGGLAQEGVDEERIHFESFGPASVSKKRIASTKFDADAVVETYPVTFKMSDKLIEWDERQGSLLDAAESNGVDIDSGCRAGSCGTCLTAILEGDVKYLDEPGIDIEKGSCLPCIATPVCALKLNA